jgi:predicted DNA-binding transcriptional regulator AlpA
MEVNMTQNTIHLLSPPAASAFLGLGLSTMAKLRMTGNGPQFAKLGKRIVYRRQDLNDWLKSHLRHSTSEGAPCQH